jgi:hypothetical protein
MKKMYDCKQINLTHARMVELRNDGKLNLGINEDFASRIANNSRLGPTKTSANIAFHFWNWVAFSLFIYTIYLSFESNWWWFLFGIVGTIFIYKANKKGNGENYLDAAMVDEDFYERIRDINGWSYQIEELNNDTTQKP